MSKLARFQKRPLEIKVEVPGDITGETQEELLKISPLKMKDLDLLLDLSNDAKMKVAIREVISRVIKENFPDYTPEEFNSMDYSYVAQILEGIMKANGLDSADAKAKFLQSIKEKQQAR